MAAAEALRGRPGQRGDVDQDVGLEVGVGVGQRVGEDEPALGVGVEHLDRAAAVLRDHVAGPVGRRARQVLGGGDQAGHPRAYVQIAQRGHDRDHGTAAAMSVFIGTIDSRGLSESPPVSNVMPLPTSTTCGRRRVGPRGLVGELDQPRRPRRPRADGEQPAEPFGPQRLLVADPDLEPGPVARPAWPGGPARRGPSRSRAVLARSRARWTARAVTAARRDAPGAAPDRAGRCRSTPAQRIAAWPSRRARSGTSPGAGPRRGRAAPSSSSPEPVSVATRGALRGPRARSPRRRGAQPAGCRHRRRRAARARPGCRGARPGSSTHLAGLARRRTGAPASRPRSSPSASPSAAASGPVTGRAVDHPHAEGDDIGSAVGEPSVAELDLGQTRRLGHQLSFHDDGPGRQRGC